MKNSGRSPLRSIGLGLSIILGIIVYAYGFNTTGVDFAKTREAPRIKSLQRILRALAHPSIFEYDREEQSVKVPFYLPCPEEGAEIPQQAEGEPYVVMAGCGEPKEFMEIEGFNFWPNVKGPINFIAASEAVLTIGHITTDETGYFKHTVQIPSRLPVEEAQTIELKVRRNIGSPYFTSMAKSSWDAIIETIFTALLATTFGTILAIPISFMAAKNLMTAIKNPLTSTALAILGWPLGIAVGIQVTRWVQTISSPISANTLSLTIVVVLIPAAGFFMLRWALPQEEKEIPSQTTKNIRLVVVVFNIILSVVFLSALANFAFNIGTLISDNYESFAFMGSFIYQLGDVLKIITPALVALAGGAIIGNYGRRIGQQISDKIEDRTARMINLIAASLSFAVLFGLIAAGIAWFYRADVLVQTMHWPTNLFYQGEDPIITGYWPAGVGLGLGLLLALALTPKQTLPTGLFIYYITRGFLNLTRSVEPLIMVIVFVVWVGIGPFAGSLALGLHTIAALAKLFSEQVESISPGPLEAIQATGANRLQTIVYAVIPQIIPPYISFTMYRWDINVRMSTIIGFAGGGGIGFLLQQNIRIFGYRDASVQMFAIAITVATMDYISSVLRERFV